jgi:hypothetical protein
MVEGTVEERYTRLARLAEELDVALAEAQARVVDLQERLDMQRERADDLSRELERYRGPMTASADGFVGVLLQPALDAVARNVAAGKLRLGPYSLRERFARYVLDRPVVLNADGTFSTLPASPELVAAFAQLLEDKPVTAG